MVRGVFWAIVTVGLAAALAKLYLQYYLEENGISALSPQTCVVVLDSLTRLVIRLHSAWNAILLSLAGALAGFVAAQRGVRLGSWSGWAGVAGATMMLVLAFSAALTSSESFSAEVWYASAAFQTTTALTICLCGAAALLSIDRWRNVAAIVITLSSWAAMVLFLHESPTLGPRIQITYFLAPLAGLAVLAATSLRLISAAAILIGGGAVSLILTYRGFASPPITPVETMRDTYYVVAQGQYLISVFGIFTLLAALIEWSQPRLAVWVVPILALLVLMGQIATSLPQIFLARSGMPRRYSEYPEAFAVWNLISSAGALLMFLAVITMIVLIWLRRTR